MSGYYAAQTTSYSSQSSMQTLSLTEACKTSDIAKVGAAIRNGKLPDAQTLTWAFHSKNISIIDAVARAGAKPDNETLTTAVGTNEVAIVKRAIQLGARSSDRTLALANSIQNRDILSLLTPQVDNTQENGLTRACKMGRLDLVQQAISQTIPPQKYTLLHAVKSGNATIVKEVINANAKPHRDPNVESELNAACLSGDIETIEDLVYIGCNPDGNTLLSAFSSKDPDVVDKVIRAGANPGPHLFHKVLQLFEAGAIELSRACPSNSSPGFDSYIENKIEPFRTKAGEMVDKVLELKAPPSGNSLDLALELTKCLHWNAWLVNALVKNGAKPTSETFSKGCLIFNLAHTDFACYFTMLKTLIEHGAKPDANSFKSIRWRSAPYKIKGISYFNYIPDDDVMCVLFAKGLRVSREELKKVETQLKDLETRNRELENSIKSGQMQRDDSFYSNRKDLEFYQKLTAHCRRTVV